MNFEKSFDNYAEKYTQILEENLGWQGNDMSVFAEYKIKLLASLLKKRPAKILEFGCGIGRNLPFIAEYFPDSQIHACDISKLSLEVAASKYPTCTFFLSETTDIFIAKAPSYDLCFLAGVLHHIPPHDRQNWLKAILSKMSIGGQIFIFEHNPYNPLTQRMVKTCPFDEEAQLVSKKSCYYLLKGAGFTSIESGYTLFFPWRWRIVEILEKKLFWLPAGAQYWLTATNL